jgi:K+-sensing histidine kinase KdpD
MSIVKDLLLIFLFIYVAYKYIRLYQEFVKQREYFIKTLSHDLRVSTLAQIRGVELLQKSIFSEGLQELISDIDKSCRYTFDMITMLLNTYRFENGEQVLSYETFNFPEIIQECVQTYSSDAKEKQVSFYLNIGKNFLLNADKYGVKKVLLMLFATSLHYSEQNSIITVNILKESKAYRVSINYKGQALSDEECRRMFCNSPRFSTVGHGIRMYLCKKIIEFHGGQICVKNSSKNTNSFTFTIPFRKFEKRPKTFVLAELQPTKL